MLLDRLNWRYATKKMDPDKAVPDEKVDAILEATRLAPTSSGLQPFEVIVVTDPAVRAKLKDAAFDQAQLVDGSHVLIFAAWDNYTEERIDGVVNDTAAARGGLTEALTGYYDRLKGMYLSRPAEVNFEHAARQAYIGLGIALTAAAFEEVDSTPMEGFEADKFDEILGLRERGLRSVAILPLGYRDADGDWLNDQAKVRRATDKFITRVDADS
ncbi:NAD(P)H-dependent oxidoreductase [Yoonia maritima]|uniref:NAD(P)H-dependent oxidoreductase n=1 Tax=Yoonia maritima TaxID=1435347 RepID=UPI000D0F411F|nr:NAD(P)H-dependent oxidoreductase [Yoonia maritima]